jgi:hypothetical protein
VDFCPKLYKYRTVIKDILNILQADCADGTDEEVTFYLFLEKFLIVFCLGLHLYSFFKIVSALG